jgi:uncharacterized membrane protein YkvA (DUF1232 family)
LSLENKSTIFYKSVQLIGYADDINIMGRIIRALSEVCKELKGTAKQVGLNISVKKTKALYTVGEEKNNKNIDNGRS